MCGGTPAEGLPGVLTGGLSPRVRGNPTPRGYGHPDWRSIPACAGEPPAYANAMSAVAVYPRVCGGTDLSFDAIRPVGGLSPRVRGNLTVFHPP